MLCMREELQSVLELQTSWTASTPNDDMQLRGLFIRGDISGFVRDRVADIAARLLSVEEDIEIEGKDSTGYYSRVPWVRFAHRQRSPSPREGWYVVYLFAEDGSEVSLSLNQGTQIWDGVGMRSRPEALIRTRSDWARAGLAEAISERSRLSSTIHLGTADKSRAYEAGNVVAYRYTVHTMPDDESLAVDLIDMADLLQLVYRLEASRPAPGDPAPEIVEAERVAQELAGRRVPRRTGFRANAKQRRAIELRAMALATEHYVALGGNVKDVSASKPFDLRVALNGCALTVEVKGTAGDGMEILLTRGEVMHHSAAHPDNALVVVSGIRLQGPPDAPHAIGGKVRVMQPWMLDPSALTVVSYRCSLA